MDMVALRETFGDGRNLRVRGPQNVVQPLAGDTASPPLHDPALDQIDAPVPDLKVSGGPDSGVCDTLRGTYSPHGEHHARTFYMKKNPADNVNVFLYYYDEREGPQHAGWWFGPKIADEHIWAFSNVTSPTPPVGPWHVSPKLHLDSTLSVNVSDVQPLADETASSSLTTAIPAAGSPVVADNAHGVESSSAFQSPADETASSILTTHHHCASDNTAETNGGNLEMMVELALLREIDLWKEFIEYIGVQAKDGIRCCLSYRFTPACRPLKQQGPGPSLREAGLEKKCGQTGGFYVCLKSDSLFEPGDGIRLDCESDKHVTLKAAQRQACIDILAFMLVSGSTHVRLNANQWNAGQEAIDTLRAKGAEIQAKRPPAPGSGGGGTVASRMLSVHPTPVPCSRRAERFAAFTPARDEAELDRREKEVLDELLTLVRGKWHPADRLPPRTWTVLKDLLPKGTLRKFLEKHPSHFEVDSPDAGGKGVWFKVIWQGW